MTPGTYIGLDTCYRAIHVGDIIMDADCRRYTIDEHGRAVTEGGKAVTLDTLSEVVVVRAYVPREVKLETFTPNAKADDAAERRKAKNREYQRRFRETHKEHLAAKRKVRRAAMTDEDRAREARAQNAYYHAHHAAVLARAKAKRDANPEKSRAACMKYYTAHRDEVNAKKREKAAAKRRCCFNCAHVCGVACHLIPTAPVTCKAPSRANSCLHYKAKTI